MTAEQRLKMDAEMSMLEHLRELRHRLILSLVALGLGFVIAYFFYDRYIEFLIRPFHAPLYTTRIEQAFLIRLRISFYAGILFSLPVHAYNLIRFILPALKTQERRLLGWLLPGSIVLLLLGGYLGYVRILPVCLAFLSRPAFRPDGVGFWLDYRAAVLFAAQLLFAFVILFQLPLILLLLMAMNLIRRATLIHYGRYIVVGIFAASAILTPPDVISQIGLALPLIALFFLTILLARVCGFGNNPDNGG